MPCINHKRKSFKSINHKTSRKSKRSTKHKSRSFRNKKTRSNLRKMRGGGRNYPDEYDELVNARTSAMNFGEFYVALKAENKNLLYNETVKYTFNVILKNQAIVKRDCFFFTTLITPSADQTNIFPFYIVSTHNY